MDKRKYLFRIYQTDVKNDQGESTYVLTVQNYIWFFGYGAEYTVVDEWEMLRIIEGVSDIHTQYFYTIDEVHEMIADMEAFLDTKTVQVESDTTITVDFVLTTERAIVITIPQDGAQVDRMTRVTGEVEGIAEGSEIVVYVVWTGEPNVRYKQDQVGKVLSGKWATQVVIGREQDKSKKFTIQAELPDGSAKSNIVAVTTR